MEQENSTQPTLIGRVIKRITPIGVVTPSGLHLNQPSEEKPKAPASLAEAERRGLKAEGRVDLNETSRFAKGDIVTSTVTAQGMKKGEEYEITDVDVKMTPFGGFVFYQLDKKMWITNGHLLLKPVGESARDGDAKNLLEATIRNFSPIVETASKDLVTSAEEKETKPGEVVDHGESETTCPYGNTERVLNFVKSAWERWQREAKERVKDPKDVWSYVLGKFQAYGVKAEHMIRAGVPAQAVVESMPLGESAVTAAKADAAARLRKAGVQFSRLRARNTSFSGFGYGGAAFVEIDGAVLPIGWKASIFGDVPKPSDGGYIVRAGKDTEIQRKDGSTFFPMEGSFWGGMNDKKRGPVYQVIVGNIGTVYDGPSRREAHKTYDEYRRQSKRGYGRAAGEDVTLFLDNEIIVQHTGTQNEESLGEAEAAAATATDKKDVSGTAAPADKSKQTPPAKAAEKPADKSTENPTNDQYKTLILTRKGGKQEKLAIKDVLDKLTPYSKSFGGDPMKALTGGDPQSVLKVLQHVFGQDVEQWSAPAEKKESLGLDSKLSPLVALCLSELYRMAKGGESGLFEAVGMNPMQRDIVRVLRNHGPLPFNALKRGLSGVEDDQLILTALQDLEVMGQVKKTTQKVYMAKGPYGQFWGESKYSELSKALYDAFDKGDAEWLQKMFVNANPEYLKNIVAETKSAIDALTPDELDRLFPGINREYLKNLKESKEDRKSTRLTEGTWGALNTPKDVATMVAIVKNLRRGLLPNGQRPPRDTGKTRTAITDALYHLVGSDDLFDTIDGATLTSSSALCKVTADWIKQWVDDAAKPDAGWREKKHAQNMADLSRRLNAIRLETKTALDELGDEQVDKLMPNIGNKKYLKNLKESEDVEGITEKDGQVTIKFKRTGPGKFSNNVDEWCYEQTMLGADDELGDVEGFGWYGLLKFETPVKVVEDGNEWSFSAAICSENSQGFFDVVTYDTAEEAESVWNEISAEYEAFSSEGDDGGEMDESKPKRSASKNK